MSDNGKCSQVLIGMNKIRDYLRGCSEKTFYGYIKAGMPAKVINGQWHAMPGTIDAWFDWFTRQNPGAVGEIEKMGGD